MNKYYYVYLDQLKVEYHSDSVRGYNLENSYIELTIEVALNKTLSSDDPIITEKAQEYANRAWRVSLTGYSVGEFYEVDEDGYPLNPDKRSQR